MDLRAGRAECAEASGRPFVRTIALASPTALEGPRQAYAVRLSAQCLPNSCLGLRRDDGAGQRMELPMSGIDGAIGRLLAAAGLTLGVEPRTETALVLIERWGCVALAL